MGSKVMMALTVTLAGACAYSTPPVPVVGGTADVQALAGEWSGEYWSLDTGRSGSILFRLEAGADSATGDVLMIPPGQMHEHPDGRHPTSEYIRISFVGIAAGHVRGALEPYRDPACGCLVNTTFEGELKRDEIEGTFVTRHVESRAVHDGRWRVSRSSRD